jgi:hypothetical protein
MTSSSMAVTASGLTARQPERIAPPRKVGAGYRGSVVSSGTSWPGRGAAGMVPRRPRLVGLERLQQLLTGVHHEGAVGGDWLTNRQPTQDQVTSAAIVLLWQE